MKPIVTLSLNPAVDGASEADVVRPTRKIRTSNERYDPGGGGINVARVIAELGHPVLPVYLAGGSTGGILDDMLAGRGISGRRVRIADHTRISHSVYERSTRQEYRFVPEGPCVTQAEWLDCLDVLESVEFEYLVASGSRPRGLDDECYATISRIAARKGARFLLDTSGPALAAALDAGGVYLIKPSLGELSALADRPLHDLDAIRETCLGLIGQAGLEHIAVTMGHDGAMLQSRERHVHLHPPMVQVRSAVGAGDSFLGAMAFGLATGRAPEDAFAIGVAAGTAAVLTPGTELCRASDVWRLHDELESLQSEAVRQHPPR
jgi:6-phosphofructokinase 2